MKNTKGFTLVELLVVIAIIGTLSSVAVVNLNTARNKGKDAAIKANLAAIPAGAESFYDEDDTYDGLDDDPAWTNAAAALAEIGGSGLIDIDDQTWFAYWSLATDNTEFWCVDSTGSSKQVTNVPNGPAC